MKQVTLVLHFNDDENAEEIYDLLKTIRYHAPEGTPFVIGVTEGKIVGLEIKGPND